MYRVVSSIVVGIGSYLSKTNESRFRDLFLYPAFVFPNLAFNNAKLTAYCLAERPCRWDSRARDLVHYQTGTSNVHPLLVFHNNRADFHLGQSAHGTSEYLGNYFNSHSKARKSWGGWVMPLRNALERDGD